MGSDVDAVTKCGRLFHTRAAATGNAVVSLRVSCSKDSLLSMLLCHKGNHFYIFVLQNAQRDVYFNE